MIISFHPAPRPKTPTPGGSRRAEADLSAAFTWLREKLWAPPVVANPKRNRSPAGRLCRQRHGDKTRNTARSKGDDGLSDPSLLSHERDFDYNRFGPSQLIYNGPADHMDCPYLSVTFVLWHLTSLESSRTPVARHRQPPLQVFAWHSHPFLWQIHILKDFVILQRCICLWTLEGSRVFQHHSENRWETYNLLLDV